MGEFRRIRHPFHVSIPTAKWRAGAAYGERSAGN
jgi:hypothetical protein